jgi:hypothetical protein
MYLKNLKQGGENFVKHLNQRITMLNFDNLYLVKFELEFLSFSEEYANSVNVETRYQLVIAKSPNEAEQKLVSHWQSKTSKYGDYYGVLNVEVIETIQ